MSESVAYYLRKARETADSRRELFEEFERVAREEGWKLERGGPRR